MSGPVRPPVAVLLYLSALSCADPAPPSRHSATREGGTLTGPRAPRADASAVARASASDAAVDGSARAPSGPPAAAEGAAARDGGSAPDAALAVKCRPASAPSWPAVAWIGEAPAVAFYDGDRTRLARVPEGDSRELARIAVMLTSGAEMAAPGLGGGRDGGLLATIEGPLPRHRLLVRAVDASLGVQGPERPVAESVDSRYGPAVLRFGDGWLVGWIDASGDVGRALVRRLAHDGAPVAEAGVLSEQPTGAAALVLSAAEDRALAAWIDPHLGFSPLTIAWSDPEGRFGPPRIVTTTGSIDRSAMVGAAAGPASSGLLVWGHTGGLGQDFLSQTLLPRGDEPARPRPLNRIDAYASLRAAALARPDGWGVAWDAPTTTGRAPPTAVKLQWLDEAGAAAGEPADLGPGGGVTASTNAGGALALAFRRGMSVCVAREDGSPAALPR